jgi:hypothetical protein
MGQPCEICGTVIKEAFKYDWHVYLITTRLF